MIEIDGSHGEGGGQILRTSLGLSMVTGRPFRIFGIRANRPKPGLMRQHLTGVLAAAAICSADVTGAEVGSRELTFTPGTVKGGEYAFAVGTAGSVALVLQAILPALVVADNPSRITIDGGTHATHAPPAEFLCDALLPIIARTGADVTARVNRHGFYPAGGGRIIVDVWPTGQLRPFTLETAGEPGKRAATAIIAGLPRLIAKREMDRVTATLGWTGDQVRIRQLPEDQGPGNALVLAIESANITEVFTGFGAKGVSAEAVADAAIRDAKAYLALGAPVGPHLADQLLVFMAMANGGSFVTGRPTSHTTTNIGVIGQFLAARFDVADLSSGAVRVAVR